MILIVFYLRLHFLLIIKSKPRLVLSESISFFKIPFLKKLKMIIIDSRKRDKIENDSIIKLLIIEFFFSVDDF